MPSPKEKKPKKSINYIVSKYLVIGKFQFQHFLKERIAVIQMHSTADRACPEPKGCPDGVPHPSDICQDGTGW